MSAADVRITGGFWAQRQEVNATASLRHCLSWMERLGWTANFDRVARGEEAPSAGREFADSEIYKLLEALAWESARSGDAWVEETFRSLSARVVAAQQPDGYLNTRFGGPGQEPRYSDLEWGHELYCAGHLIQAAVARARTAGRDEFVEAAIRLADHICEAFGPGRIERVDGHPEIEPALAELYRVTGDRRYLEQARLFLQRRGTGTLDHGEIGPEYFQDDVPVRDADVLRGHAVRALYLSMGAVDVAVEDRDAELLGAVTRQWRNTVARRTYLTGGMGSRHEGESFGDDFELPSDRAYSETCAGVASVMLSHRLLLAEGRPEYADLIERTLFNVVATSPDAAGTSFFYVNPLQRNAPGTEAETDRPSPRAASSQRAHWFDVSCCPTNVARTLASLSGYVATTSDRGLQLQQYAEGTIDTRLASGDRVRIRVETDYPWSGTVTVAVEEAPGEDWTLALRVPAWARGRARIADATGAERVVEEALAEVPMSAGELATVRLELPLEPRLTLPDPRIDSLRSSVAVEAGPLVLCAESVDLPAGTSLRSVAVPADAAPAAMADGAELAGVHVHEGEDPWPYGPAEAAEPDREIRIPLIPYHRWAERGPSEMRVWLPRLPA
ncbi:beta-L-arabinofuranosidase domain-containing protein [Naasia sp. SYSU D00057]|uniref:glycoside hydrolase family 127 protein n=1 Tax=Naasia sp. SYSU D00057 TaxID=2817380 RepID=UPI0027DD6B8F|nr:beta-L-arabinofuranosidase domain-containing protein [Naasia sp. SYSU D00057]